MSMADSTSRKVALITGSGRGIGQAFADRLARDGYNLVLADLKPPTATAGAAADHGVEALAVAADVSSPDAVAALHEQAISRFGRVDVLVNNAGWGQIIPFEDTTLDHWHKVFGINLDGVYLTGRTSRTVGRGAVRLAGKTSRSAGGPRPRPA
jgi:pyridoxal 4-dehydrogenase